MSETFDLDRETNLKHNIDATGKKWVIHRQRSNGLLYVRPEPDRVDAVIPKELSGLWTKIGLLQSQLDLYLANSWEKADKAKAANERKAQAAKEAKKKVADDAGKAANA